MSILSNIASLNLGCETFSSIIAMFPWPHHLKGASTANSL